MNISIDQSRCNGHGRCYTLAPSLFDADDEGRGFVITDGVIAGQVGCPAGADLLGAARLAATNCPEHAIDVTE